MSTDLSFPEFYPPSEALADALGVELGEDFRATRLWHGEATMRLVIERVARVPASEQAKEFLRAFADVKRQRKQAGIWPQGKYREWYGAEAEDGDHAWYTSPLVRRRSGVYGTPAERLRAAETLIGREFSDRALLARALTHSSAGADHNEALACLGDRLYNAWAARRVFGAHPGAAKGGLTDAIIALCRGEAQAAAYFALGLHETLSVVGRDGITAPMASTALEAIVAALVLDAGQDVADTFLDRIRPVGEG